MRLPHLDSTMFKFSRADYKLLPYCGKNVRGEKPFKAGVHTFSKKLRANTKFLVLKGSMKQVPY